MVSNTVSIKILLAIGAIALVLPYTQGLKCFVMLREVENENERKTIEDCHKSNKVDYKNSDIGPNTTVETYDFDDNCNQQCVYKGLALLTAEETVLKDGTSVLFKDDAIPADLLGKISETWNKCIEDAEKIGKEKGFTPCKVSTLHSYCFHTRLYEGKVLQRDC